MSEILIKNNSNLVDSFARGDAKILLNNPNFEKIYANLIDESKDLSERLCEFENSVSAVYSDKKRILKDERSASFFLTCNNTEKYTFYKDEYYTGFCKYLGVKTEEKGEKYKHYILLINELVSYIQKDKELMKSMETLTEKYVQSEKLIAQNIIYTAFGNEKSKRFLKTEGASEMTKSEKIIKLLRQKKNIILQGAPGTGKTYSTAEIALSVLGYNVSQYASHKELMDAYNDLLIKIDESSGEITGGQIGFVTFHQSMDYEDFVEGIKPKTDEAGNVTYAVEDGIFKAIANKAAKNGEAESGNFEECWKKLIELLNEEEKLSVHTLSGKTTFDIELNEYGDGLASRTYEGNNDDWTRGKSKFFNKKQLENIYKGLPGIPSGGHDNYRKAIIKFMKEDKRIGLSDYKPNENVSAETKPYVLIIDEINRGNVSKIFGELITLLESDKRQGGEHPLSVILPYSKKRFSVPSNLYIIGTMNTTDRSVGNIDYAVRRRFSFVTLESSRKVVSEKCGEESTAVRLFDSVKNFLEKNKIEMDIDDLMVGHSYFLSDDESELEIKWEFDILPLLREYYKDGIIKRDVPKNCKIDDFIKENSESQTE